MPTLTQTFDARDQDLNDLLADQSLLVAVQTLIVEILDHASPIRIEGIIDEIHTKFGAFAIPGIISATYIYGESRIKGQTEAQIARILITAAKDNPSACKMILRNGVTRNPFEATHKIFLAALAGLQYTPDEEDLDGLQALLSKARVDSNPLRALSCFTLLLPQQRELKIAETTAIDWFRRNLSDDAAKLTNLLFRYTPQRITDYMSRLIAREYGLQSAAPESIQKEIHLNSDEDAIAAINGCFEALNDGQRNKQIEYFHTGPLARRIAESPSLLALGDKLVRKSELENAERYWWQAVSYAKSQHVIEYMTSGLSALCAAHDSFAVYGIVQLLYLAKNTKNTWAGEQLIRVQVAAPSLYEEAQAIFNKMADGKKRVRQTSDQVTKTSIQQKEK
jgi:hypothetical protein